MEKIDFSLSEKTKKALVSDPFGLEETVELSHNYLKIPKVCPTYIHKYYFTGLFSASLFKISDAKSGIRFWYCLKNGKGPFPKFFLALEILDRYDENNPEEQTNMGKSLFLPKIRRYWNKPNDKPHVTDFLKSSLFKYTLPNPNRISKENVIKFSQNFKECMSKAPENEMGISDPFCEYSTAYFINNNYFKTFMARNPDRVAFIMGYSTDSSHFPNYLRPILAGVDKKGNIILPKKNNVSGNLEEKTFLQDSWPPPPKS